MDKAANCSLEEYYQSVRRGFHIYFPTRETVTASTAGYAGTICIQSKYYENPKFPRLLMRDCQSVRRGVLMHNKMIFVRPKSKGRAWAYVGSANCSESAWGNKLVIDKTTKQPKLNCRNWECGVLIPVESKVRSVGYKVDDTSKFEPSKTYMPEESSGASDLDVFKGIIPIPMHFPGEDYGARKPWYFLEHE
ncbi:MAG: hypothetical protein Q9163_003706 [Psora crenata]